MRTLLEQVAQPRSNDTTVYIYGLVDPRNTAVRYVGKSVKPRIRYNTHLQPAQLKRSSRKNNWIKSLLALGLKPELVVLDTIYNSEWCAEEIKWIARFRSIDGYPQLTNVADGGQGHHNVIAEEVVKRRSQARIGVPMPIGTGAKISAANKGRKKTREHRENLSVGQKKRWENASEGDKKKMQNFPLPNMTEEIRKKIIVGLRNIPRRAGCASIYRGVTKVDRTKPWQAACSVNNRHKYIGSFFTEEEAARARDRFILENFPGWNIELNFPRSDYQ